MPVLGEPGLPLVQQRRSPRRRCGGPPRRRAGRPPRRRAAGRASAAQRAAAEVEAVELHLARGVGQRQRRRSACAAGCSCRSAARRRRPRCPPAPARSSHEQVPALLERLVDDADRHRAGAPCSPGQPAVTARASGRRRAAPSSSSRVGGSASGGSHTWWAGRPWPCSRSTSTSSIADGLAASAGSSAPARPPAACGAGTGTKSVPYGHDPPLHQRLADALPLPRRPVRRRRRTRPGTAAACSVSVLQVAVAGGAGQLVRVRHAEHDPALHRGEGPQTDPVRQVGVQPAQPALLQPLGGQQQVHAERPAEPADLHEEVDEVRLGGEQLAELVADDQQARQRGQRRAGRPGPSRSRAARRSCRPPAAAPAGGPARR